jgi:hypothetical protein
MCRNLAADKPECGLKVSVGFEKRQKIANSDLKCSLPN